MEDWPIQNTMTTVPQSALGRHGLDCTVLLAPTSTVGDIRRTIRCRARSKNREGNTSVTIALARNCDYLFPWIIGFTINVCRFDRFTYRRVRALKSRMPLSARISGAATCDPRVDASDVPS